MDPLICSIMAINWGATSIYAAIIITLLFCSSFFSKSETVFSSVSKAKLMTFIDENKKGARKALWLADNFDKVLSVLLVGNNLVNIAISTLGLRLFLGLFELDGSYVDVINTIAITVVVLIFGEILPKSKGKSNPEKNALKLSGVLYVVVKILTPISYPFYKMNKLTMNEDLEDAENISSDDLENIIDTMEEEGEIDSKEADMLQKVLDLNEVDVKDIMTPRVDCIYLDINTPIDDIKKCFFQNQYSRVPVYKDSIDHIVGVLFEKDFFKEYINNPKLTSIKRILQKPVYVVGSMRADDLLTLFKKKKNHLAIVVDEYGGFDGVVTMEDCLEELVGEIFDEHDDVPITIKEIGENKYEVSGDLEIENLFDYFDLEGEIETEATTVGGLVQDLLERLPEVGDTVQIKIISKVIYSEIDSEEGIEYKLLVFTVKEIESNRITTVDLDILDTDGDEETVKENE